MKKPRPRVGERSMSRARDKPTTEPGSDVGEAGPITEEFQTPRPHQTLFI